MGPTAALVKRLTLRPRTSNCTQRVGRVHPTEERSTALEEHPRLQAGVPSAGSRATHGPARREA